MVEPLVSSACVGRCESRAAQAIQPILLNGPVHDVVTPDQRMDLTR